MGLWIRNGTVVTALDRFEADILCLDGKIAAIGPDLDPSGSHEVVDAAGHYVFPGGIDPHVHMELPLGGTVSADDFESGTAAGVAGGTTTIIDFVIPDRGEPYEEALRERRALAARSVADYALHQAITWWDEKTPDFMRRCVETEGMPSFKTFMAYHETVGVEDDDLIRIMQTARQLGALVTVHAEHGEMIAALQRDLIAQGKTGPQYHAVARPSALEGEAAARAAVLARMTGAPLYVVHVSCRDSLEAIVEARAHGQPVYGETCPQYLLLDDSAYDRPDFEAAAYVLSPPLRPRGHQEALWNGLRAGWIDTVATDHCPFDLHGQKDRGKDDFRLIPNGIAGIENRMALLYTYGVGTGHIDLHQFVDLCCTRSAKLFGLYPRKGAIAVGADADLVVWDPDATSTISARTHRHRVDRNVFEGFEVRGLPSVVIVGGRVRLRDGNLDVEAGAGRYLSRKL